MRGKGKMMVVRDFRVQKRHNREGFVQLGERNEG